ncbi:cytochrome c-type biogenesis protein CcmH [Pantoea sp. B65]|uniref:cytochrome c-type biogenesis protein n=1 Tax=Pantoea sp. B65 TaxID=2813359 RepID=UPI0039B512D2
MKSLIALVSGLLLACSAFAAIDTLQFDSPAQEQQYRQITESLRCPKCQNNSIADSNAMIAGDMRLKVYQLMKQGQSKQQITDYMVARYGNFVSYQPPLTASTLILWAGPLLFVLLGALLIMVRSRKSLPDQQTPPDAAEQQRLDKLLKNNRKSS